jgi:hypothetical protein
MTSIGGTAALGTGNYNGGAERTWTTNAIDFWWKSNYNANNTPVAGAAAGSNIQTQANNGVIYNTTALPGKIISVTINSVGTARESSLFGGSARLVNNTTADYTVTEALKWDLLLQQVGLLQILKEQITDSSRLKEVLALHTLPLSIVYERSDNGSNRFF